MLKPFIFLKKDSSQLFSSPCNNLQHWDNHTNGQVFLIKKLFISQSDSNVDEIKYDKLDKMCEREEWRRKQYEVFHTVIECAIIQIINVSSRDWFSETNEIFDIDFSQ